MDCGACGSTNPTGKRFCGKCGAPLARACGACGAENPPGNSTNNFLLVRIDKLTGRARVEKQEFP